MNTTSSIPTGTPPVAPTPASTRKRKTQSIIFSSSSSASPSPSPSQTTTEEPIFTPPPLRIMTQDPSTLPDQPNESSHFNATATTATTSTTATTPATNRRQFRVSATFGGSGSNSGSGSSLLTSSTPSSASSPLSTLAETLTASPTNLFTTQLPYSLPNLGTPNSLSTGAAAAGKVSPTQGCHPLNTIHRRTETETDTGASVKAKTAQDPNASQSSPTSPTSVMISSPMKSSTFGNFFFLPTDPAPPSPVRENLLGGLGNDGSSSVGPLDTTVHSLDRPALVSNPILSDTIMEEDEEQHHYHQQPHPLDPSPRLRQQGTIATPFTTALTRPRARYTFGYDEPLISSLPPRENSISSSSSSCSSPTSPRSPSSTASPPPPKTPDVPTKPVVISGIKKKSPPQQDVLSTLPLSSAVHSPRLHSTSSPSTPPSSPASTRVNQLPSPECLRPPRSLQRVNSKSTPQPPVSPTPTPFEAAVPSSPPASPRLSGRKRFSFLANLLGTTPPPPWSSSISSFDTDKPLPATPPAGASQLHRHYSLQQQQQQHGRHGSRQHSSARPPKFKNASAIDLPSYAASMSPSTTTSNTATSASTVTTAAMTPTSKSSSATYLNQYQDVKSLMSPPSAPSKMMMMLNKNRGGSNASMKALYDHYDDRNHSHDHQDASSIYRLHENYYSQEEDVGRSGGSGESDQSADRSHQSHEEGRLVAGEYLSLSSTNPYSVSQTSLKIQILPSISQYALHRQQQPGTAERGGEGGVGNGQSRSRSRLDLTIVLVPENSHQSSDNKFNGFNKTPDPSKMDSPQVASPRKGKKRCASLSIFRYFLKK